MVRIKDPGKQLPVIQETDEAVLREELKDLRRELLSIAYHKRTKLAEVQLLDDRYKILYYRANAIERKLTPVKIISTPKVDGIRERAMGTDEAMKYLMQLPADELAKILAALEEEPNLQTGEPNQEEEDDS